MPPLHRPSARSSRSGFTLIEVIAATLIFFLMVTFALWAMSDSYQQSMSAQDARILRMLAERKLGEVAIFEEHYNYESGSTGRFDDLPEEMRDAYASFEWETEVRDVTVFGTQTDPHADYLFESPESETDALGTDPTSGASGAGAAGATGAQKKGDTQMLREIVLRVRSPSEEGESDMIEIVTYLPQVPAKTAGGAAGTGGTGGGN